METIKAQDSCGVRAYIGKTSPVPPQATDGGLWLGGKRQDNNAYALSSALGLAKFVVGVRFWRANVRGIHGRLSVDLAQNYVHWY